MDRPGSRYLPGDGGVHGIVLGGIQITQLVSKIALKTMFGSMLCLLFCEEPSLTTLGVSPSPYLRGQFGLRPA